MTRRLFDVALADEVRAELARRHQTIIALSLATTIAERTLKRRLSGATPFSGGELELIADALDIEAGELQRRAHAAIEAAMRRHPAGSAQVRT